jgi:hypothetical protein
MINMEGIVANWIGRFTVTVLDQIMPPHLRTVFKGAYVQESLFHAPLDRVISLADKSHYLRNYSFNTLAAAGI